jgi:2'-5' RNA ligase
MPFAISIKTNNESAKHIRDLWARVGVHEDTPSMASLNYAPHITLAIYDRINADLLKQALVTTFNGRTSLRIAFDRIRCFEQLSLVLWAAPVVTTALIDLHGSLHSQIDPEMCRPHYRPGSWVPHCTLGTKIREDRQVMHRH